MEFLSKYCCHSYQKCQLERRCTTSAPALYQNSSSSKRETDGGPPRSIRLYGANVQRGSTINLVARKCSTIGNGVDKRRGGKATRRAELSKLKGVSNAAGWGAIMMKRWLLLPRRGVQVASQSR